MRVLIANDGFADAGGVQTYLDAVAPALASRGHELALLHSTSSAPPAVREAAERAAWWTTRIPVAEVGVDRALAAVAAWAPDVCFSHNMFRLDVESGLLRLTPVVKFMHGYFGSCIGGQKMFRFPQAAPCDRKFGVPCLALYLPRGCGERDPAKMMRHYRWARRQQALFSDYAAIIVASGHMQREYVRNGADTERVYVAPLFAGRRASPAHPSVPASVVFCGRMTTLKGGDVLIAAVADASRRLGAAIPLAMIGDGPQREAWERRALQLGVASRFTGWLSGDALWQEMGRATLLAVPSTWPEPFGLVGIEGASLGVPAIAFDVGGIREWLRPGENGYLVPASPPRATALGRVLAGALVDPATAAMRVSALRVAGELSLTRHIDGVEPILLDARRRVVP